MNPAALYLARAGRHACYDRLVFDVNSAAATGFAAHYVPVVQADASGQFRVFTTETEGYQHVVLDIATG